MSANHAATGWTENDFLCSSDHSHPAIMSYFASSPILESESTGIRALLDVSSSGSGSRYSSVVDSLSQLEERLVSIDISGNWIVLSITKGAEREVISPPTIPEKLDQVRNAFGLSMSALADVLQASRASVYNWYETAPRSEHILQRIETLFEIAREWQEINPYHYPPGKLMKQKLGDGPSMLERLGRDVLDMEEVQQGMDGLMALMRKQRERMDRAKARSANTPADSESYKALLERITGSVTADK